MSYPDDLLAGVQNAGAAYDTFLRSVMAESAAKDLVIADLKAQLEPPKPPMRVGISVKDQAQWDTRTADFGVPPQLARVFFPGLPGKLPNVGTARTIVSFKPPNNDVAGFIAGKYDAQVTAWLTSYHGMVAIYHEREDNIERGEFTLDQADAMDAHMASLVAKYGQARFGIILMEWTLNPGSGRALEDYVTGGGGLYKWIGWDAYPADSATNDLPALFWTTIAFGRCAKAAEALGLPWFLTETGTRNLATSPLADYDDRQATWIEQAFPMAESLGCRGITYFDSTVGGDFRIMGDRAKAAMGAAIRA